MSLYPDAPRTIKDPTGKDKYALDDEALKQSMTKDIEDATADVFGKVKGAPLPTLEQDDLRLLFAAILRGVLKYLYDHQVTITAAKDQGAHSHSVKLNVTMDSPASHP
jgi:hypothetical protein